MTAKRPTITDVAQHAGVSKATVSAVLNDTPGVKPATRDRVLAAIELLNYRPSQLAGRAGARKDRSIAILIKEHDNPYYASIVDGVRDLANARGYTVLIVTSAGEYETERRAVELLRAKDVDGLIVTPVNDTHADLSHYFELKRRNVPFVLLEEVRGLPASLVDVDNVAAARQTVEYLLRLGHSRIAHLSGPRYSVHSAERVTGVRLAFSASRLAFNDSMIVPAGAHLEDGYRAALALFQGRPPDERPTAVTCYNDLVAVGLCRALAELGLRVPDDVSVIGFDDVPLCEYLPVPLTSIRVPTRQMGELAAEMLVRHIEAKVAVKPQRVYLEAALIERRSTTPPPADRAAHPPRGSRRSRTTATSGVP